MNSHVLTVTMFLAFCVGILSIYLEKRKRNHEIWMKYIDDFEHQIKWLKHSSDFAGGIPAKSREDYSFVILNEVFKTTKHLIGSTKDKLLSCLKLDPELVKRNVKEKYQYEDNGTLINPYEKIEYEVTAFCERYKDVDVIEFASDPASVKAIDHLENTHDFLSHYFADETLNATWLSNLVAFLSSLVPNK